MTIDKSRRIKMDLKDKKCLPCESWVPPLSDEQKESFLQNLGPEWSFTHEKTRIIRHFKFKNFKKAMEFAIEAGKIAENEKHHPDLHLGWGYCNVEISTHSQQNLFENDFILAAKINEAFTKAYPASEA
jgi:4a-hydroxytetrahydrobiopterin dehydratase